MKHLYILFLGLTLITSCKDKTITKKPETTTGLVKVINEREVIIQTILDLPKLQWIFHAELADRLPIKLAANAYVNDSLKLQKFKESVNIATVASFKKDNIQDYLIFTVLNIKTNTVYFEFTYPIEGVSAKGQFIKTENKWQVQRYDVFENSNNTPQAKIKDTIRTLVYKGEDLGYLANHYYGNKTYRHVLSAYNSFEDKLHIDKKQDLIQIPKLLKLSRDVSLQRLNSLSEYLDKLIEARTIYIAKEKALWALPKDSENRNLRNVPQSLKEELLAASKLIYECISGLEQHRKRPNEPLWTESP